MMHDSSLKWCSVVSPPQGAMTNGNDNLRMQITSNASDSNDLLGAGKRMNEFNEAQGAVLTI